MAEKSKNKIQIDQKKKSEIKKKDNQGVLCRSAPTKSESQM
jgi:hypothetical protein